MKVLSVKQPWAFLICSGKKEIENRTWATKYRGRIMIHASKAIDSTAPYNFIGPIGAIIGEVDIVDVVTNSQSEWAEKDCKHWVLKNPALYEIPILGVKGKLGLWDRGVVRHNPPGA